MVNIYDLKINESIIIEEGDWSFCTVRRVPGGWIYETYCQEEKQIMTVGFYCEMVSVSSVFVPYNPEFKP